MPEEALWARFFKEWQNRAIGNFETAQSTCLSKPSIY